MSTLLTSETRSRLARLLEASDFDFHNEASSYASHSFHAFAAKFPPQLPAVFIKELTSRGETVIDPMVGSGTTLVEALRLGRHAFGYDIDPLAVMMCKVKTRRIDSKGALVAGERVMVHAGDLLTREEDTSRFLRGLPEENRDFINFWFARTTQRELAALLVAIEDETEEHIRDFLRLVVSSIIITKSGGVSLARDLAHSRPHKDPTKTPRNAIDQFRARLGRAVRGLGELPPARGDASVVVEIADCRVHLPLPDDSTELMVTSPPYANAIDYMRAHKFSLVWLGRNLAELTRLRGEYIGAEKTHTLLHAPLPGKVEKVVRTVGARDRRKAMVLRKYFVDMTAVMSEMYRVLQRGRAAIVVVGSSTIRGLRVDTPRCLGEIGRQLGYEIGGIKRRKLDRNRRMMPARFRNNGQSTIERRMHEEYVIGLLKP